MKKRLTIVLIIIDFCLTLFISLLVLNYLFQPHLAKNTKTIPLLLNQPFTSPAQQDKKEAPLRFTLVVTGDTMLGRHVNTKMHQKSDFTYPFQKIAPTLKEADLAFTNLESPFFNPCPKTSTGMRFCANKKALEGLLFSGADVLNLANNHILNYGQKGLEYTIKLLSENSLSPLYCHENYGTPLCPLRLKINNQSIAFLGYDLTIYPNQEEKIIEEIKKTKPQVDLLFVSLHWGVEYQPEPTSAQVNLAHQIIDAGADLLIGHHPHVIQPQENYQDKLILYSLGNFVFDQSWSQSTKTGLIAKITFEDKKITQQEFFKVYIQDNCQPEIITN
jgi:poly-gamma-glutamate synthesis protein (capsule biosynthesis protein)